jgi:DNA-binding transcriptional MerR regulator
MIEIDENSLKRYYSIGEVAKLFEISTSQIRFWESEFDTLSPVKNSKGDRRFTPTNIQQLKLIFELVKEKGYTIAGAKQELATKADYYKKKAATIEKLRKIRSSITELIEEL